MSSIGYTRAAMVPITVITMATPFVESARQMAVLETPAE